MSRNFEIVANTVPWLIGFGGVGWIFWHWVVRGDLPVGTRFKLIFSLALVIGEILFVGSMTGLLHGGGLEGDFGSAFMVAGSLAVFGFIMSLVWTPQIASFFVGLLMSGMDGGKLPPQAKPYYSVAVAKRKRHKPLEAVDVIREYLAKNPDDFDGVMLLANIQAEDLKDLASAEMTVNRFCEWEQAPVEQVAAALGQLTDWRLKFYQEASATKAELQRVVEKYPGTSAAFAARERIARLGGPGMERATSSAASIKSALQLIVDRYPGTAMAVAARERIAQLDWVGGSATCQESPGNFQ